MKKLILAIFFFPLALLAQDNSTVAMADSLRADGKIYVVLAVILVILFGIFFYLFKIERQLNKIEGK
jgi:tellurite resistance protein TehA-like permease